jgi:hypothetical protein
VAERRKLGVVTDGRPLVLLIETQQPADRRFRGTVVVFFSIRALLSRPPRQQAYPASGLRGRVPLESASIGR